MQPESNTSSTTVGDKEKYATYKHDAATDLSYADQRYYATGAGRFMTADPYKASAGANDPGSWNRYSYVRGDPANYIDPNGLADFSVTGYCQGCSGLGGSLSGHGGGYDPYDRGGHLMWDESMGPLSTWNQQYAPSVDAEPPRPHCGVNPITNSPGMATLQDGVPGNYRPGRRGGGTFTAPRNPAPRVHGAIDIAGPLGADIHNAVPGRVLSITDRGDFGLAVWVDIGGGLTVIYAHPGSTSVIVGQALATGEILRELGQSGNADGQPLPEAHLHLEIRRNGVRINPANFLNSNCPTGVGQP